ncbi:protein of unknown function [Methylocaldum szegediense]|uniref:Uncharacterized protein n=1 Tax=Methylocaldum szegediense TaxID=73780 RepID=A0ABM9I128_9GAMM|nr:protein of unknown function [Methylocaldum szegediense]
MDFRKIWLEFGIFGDFVLHRERKFGFTERIYKVFERPAYGSLGKSAPRGVRGMAQPGGMKRRSRSLMPV